MKFFLCGGSDAPDWILPHVAALSYVSAAKIKLLAGHLIRHMLEGAFEYDKVLKVTADASLGGSDVKACIAALHFVLASAAKFDVDPATLSRELQQLGLPREHSDALSKSYGEERESLQAKFFDETLQGIPLQICGWETHGGSSGSVVLQLTRSGQEAAVKNKYDRRVSVTLPVEKLRLLLYELKTSRMLMEGLL